MYSAECDGPKLYKTLMFMGQAGMFLSFQARRSSATRSSTSDLTVFLFGALAHCIERMTLVFLCFCFPTRLQAGKQDLSKM